mmetsp:Transcript_28103/g.74184  ORF Transcript_28103/g.74184 Transcript_28103/m.74184 type:complete len:244 (+) Transcript_28103:528-1259(+)
MAPSRCLGNPSRRSQLPFHQSPAQHVAPPGISLGQQLFHGIVHLREGDLLHRPLLIVFHHKFAVVCGELKHGRHTLASGHDGANNFLLGEYQGDPGVVDALIARGRDSDSAIHPVQPQQVKVRSHRLIDRSGVNEQVHAPGGLDHFFFLVEVDKAAGSCLSNSRLFVRRVAKRSDRRPAEPCKLDCARAEPADADDADLGADLHVVGDWLENGPSPTHERGCAGTGQLIRDLDRPLLLDPHHL